MTTDSNINLLADPNLAGSMELTGIDQLWIADITYIQSQLATSLRREGTQNAFFSGITKSTAPVWTYVSTLGRLAFRSGRCQGLEDTPERTCPAHRSR